MNAKGGVFTAVGIFVFSTLLGLIIAYLVVTNHKPNTELDSFIWMGNLSSTSITFKFCTKNASVPVRLGLSTQMDFSNPIFSDLFTPTSIGFISLSFSPFR